MTTLDMSDLIPLSPAARMAGMSRERLLRRVQTGATAGDFIAGRWFVRASAVAQLCRTQSGTEKIT